MEETLRSNLLDLLGRFKTATTQSTSAIGQESLRDHTFFRRLERGDGFNVKTFDKLVAWFSENWPPDAEWPSDIPRPVPSERSAA